MPDPQIPAIAPEGYIQKLTPQGPRRPGRLAMRAIPEPGLHLAHHCSGIRPSRAGEH